MKILKDKVVGLEFRVYDNDTNELLEDTKEVGTFAYIHGNGMFVPLVEERLEGKEEGFKDTIIISPEEGYGHYNEELIDTLEKSAFAEFDDIYEGMNFVADLDDGTAMEFYITEIDGDKVTIDGNHPFADRTLRFEVEVTEVRDATEHELNHGHIHEHSHEEGGCCGGHHHHDEEHECCGGHHQDDEEHECCCKNK